MNTRADALLDAELAIEKELQRRTQCAGRGESHAARPL
jgi:hypothetical protein